MQMVRNPPLPKIFLTNKLNIFNDAGLNQLDMVDPREEALYAPPSGSQYLFYMSC